MYEQIFRQALSEHLVKDRRTNMKLFSLSEDQLAGTSDNLISHLYTTAVEKYNYIDFGNIPDSKGDITRFKGLKTLQDTLDTLDQLSKKSGVTRFQQLEDIKEALGYLEKHKVEFSKGFLTENKLIEVIYNTLVYSILGATNLLISIYVDYIKTPGLSLDLAIDTQKKHRDFILFKSIKDFNTSCRKGDMVKLFASMKDKSKFIGVGALGVGALVAAALLIVPIIRQMIFSVYDVRMSVAQYLEQQSEFLKLNAETLQDNNTMTTRIDRKKVIKNQMNTAKKLETLSNKIAVKFEDADKKGKKELDKRISLKDIEPTFNNSIGSSNSDDSFGDGGLI